MPAINSLHQPLPLFRFRSFAITADRRRLTQKMTARDFSAATKD
jgi:hypothetical protein